MKAWVNTSRCRFAFLCIGRFCLQTLAQAATTAASAWHLSSYETTDKTQGFIKPGAPAQFGGVTCVGGQVGLESIYLNPCPIQIFCVTITRRPKARS